MEPIQKLKQLINKWDTMVNTMIPEEYRSRGLEHKYLNLNTEAAGMYLCARELEDFVKEMENEGFNE